MNPEHVRVDSRADGAAVIIDDWELFDYVDDYLAERGLEYDHLTEDEVEGRRVFTMHFAADVPAERVSTALAELPKAEIERIWRLNND